MSRQTSSPLPDLASLPSDFLDHLLLITQTLVNSKPPPAVLRAMSRDPTRNANGTHGKCFSNSAASRFSQELTCLLSMCTNR